jgi:hypothetical protein
MREVPANSPLLLAAIFPGIKCKFVCRAKRLIVFYIYIYSRQPQNILFRVAGGGAIFTYQVYTKSNKKNHGDW